MSGSPEIGWLPDSVYTGEKFESGLAFFADGLGRISRFSRAPADLAAAKRLAGQVALPGLVNGYSQAFHRVLRGHSQLRSRSPAPGTSWPELIGQMASRLTAEEVYDVARMAFLEMMLSGITCTAEFHCLHGAGSGEAKPEPNQIGREIVRAARDLGLRLALVNVAFSRPGFRRTPAPAEARLVTATADRFVLQTDALREFIGQNCTPDEAWLGIAPYHLQAIPLDYLKAIASYAHTHRLRLFVPVAEQPDDNEASVAEQGRRPVVLLAEQGMLGKRMTLVHAVHITVEEARLIGSARATVCTCPTSGRVSGQPIAPIDLLLAEGASISLGTGSQVQISLFDEARQLESRLRGGRADQVPLGPDPATTLFHAATVSGARSLGAPGGALEVGRPADFFTVNLFDPSIAGADPKTLLNQVVFSLERRAIREVWVGARLRLANGRHPLQGPIIGRFVEAQRRLWALA